MVKGYVLCSDQLSFKINFRTHRNPSVSGLKRRDIGPFHLKSANLYIFCSTVSKLPRSFMEYSLVKKKYLSTHLLTNFTLQKATSDNV